MNQRTSRVIVAFAVLFLSLLASSCAWLAAPPSTASLTAQDRLPEACRSKLRDALW
ncbi:MAG: hypothetical protein WA970_10340 [Gammaproteobacteria bacterium]